MVKPQIEPLPEAEKNIKLETSLGSKAPAPTKKATKDSSGNKKFIYFVPIAFFVIYIVFLITKFLQYA